MSLQNATAFVQRLSEDSALAARVQSKDDAVKFGTELGTPFTATEFEQAVNQNTGDLSSDVLKNIAGGFKAR